MYDASHELQYLDMVLEETLRMYSPAPMWVDKVYVQHEYYWGEPERAPL